MTIDTTYQLQPGESIQAYNQRIAAYNASKAQSPAPVQAPQSGSIVPVAQPAQIQQPPQQTAPQQPPPAQPYLPVTQNLQPGSTGADVTALQNWLINQGYAIPAGATGTYGPQTTAAVEQLQKKYGVDTSGGGAGYFGPKTQAALAQKYQSMFASKQGSEAPTDASGAMQSMQQSSQQSTDPFFGAITSSIAPILGSLQQVLSNINNPALTGTSLQTEYNDLAAQNGLPAMQSQLLNMQNVMNGTEQDIRDEVSATGGFATESQVQGLAAARNRVLMKNYTALSSQYQAAVTNVQNMMQYAATDQATQLQKQSMSASIAESIGSLEQSMLQMGMTMQNNARSAAQYNISQTGYKAFAQTLQGNPQMQSSYENLLGLAPGTLSNPAALDSLDTYKEQSLQLTNTLRGVQLYNATGDSSYLQGLNQSGQVQGNGTGYVGSFISSLGQGASTQMPLSQAVQTYGIPAMYQATTSAEGGSLPGVDNNPVNLAYAPWMQQYGGYDSGVQKADGGTFASFPTQQDNMNAYGALVQGAASGQDTSYGANPTVGSFLSTYGGLPTSGAPIHMAGVNGSSIVPGIPAGIYNNTDPMTASNIGGTPQGSGTYAASSGLLLSPQDPSTRMGFLQAAGLNNLQLQYMIGNTSAITKMSTGQKNALNKSVDAWYKAHPNVDPTLIKSEYNAYSDTVTKNISRLNQTKLAEGEVLGSMSLLGPEAAKLDLQDLNIGNVAQIAAGKQVNDPQANAYYFYFKDLQNSLGFFYAAQEGRTSPELIDQENAAQAISSGIAQGGLKGLSDAMQKLTQKQQVVNGQLVDSSQKAIWDLFGVGDQYASPDQMKVQVKSPQGQTGSIPASQLTDALSQGYIFGSPIPLTPIPGLEMGPSSTFNI